jgi:hypothetical protein
MYSGKIAVPLGGGGSLSVLAANIIDQTAQNEFASIENQQG